MTIILLSKAFVNELKTSGFTRQQSEKVISVLKKAQGELATKSDLHSEILELKVGIVKWAGALMLAQVAVIAALVKLI